MPESVLVDYRKWPDTPHWQLPTTRLGEDEHGAWLHLSAGTEIRRGAERPKIHRDTTVVLVPRDAWWTAIWNARAPIGLYVDVTTPACWSERRVTAVDLDLDVVRDREGRVRLLDEDELVEHARALGHPDRLVTGARATAERLLQEVARHDEPFGETGPRWVGRALALDELG